MGIASRNERSSQRLADAEQIAFAVAEPGASLSSTFGRIVPVDVGDAVDRLHAGQVEFLELDTPRLEVGDRDFDVVDRPPHLRRFARSLARRLEDDEIRRATLIAQSARPFFDGNESELLRIPIMRTVEV